MIGKELINDNSLSFLEKVYIFFFGVPINGLRIRVHRILPLLKSMKFKSVLDAGCGMGIFSFEIAKRNPDVQVLGVDSDAKLIEKANLIACKSGLMNCRFMVQDIADSELAEKFDLVLCVDMLEHIENDQEAIVAIYRTLKKDGVGIFHVPGFYRRWLVFKKTVNFYVKGHVRPGYNLSEIKEKLQKANFEILDAYYTYGYLETITNNVSYLITGAQKKNKFLYALVFPLLNLAAYFGQWKKPEWGAGVLLKVKK